MTAWQALDAPEIGLLAEMPSPLSLLAAGVDASRDPRDYAAAFARDRAFAFSGLLEDRFAAKIHAVCERARFVADADPAAEHRTKEESGVAGTAIGVALQRPAFLRWIEQATGCGPLVSAYGTVLRMPADGRSNLWWHDDLRTDPSRRIGVTIYLGGAAYDGALFELRKKTGNLLIRHRHTTFGSALLFSVAPDVEHRVSPITSGGPRQVFTGWLTRG